MNWLLVKVRPISWNIAEIKFYFLIKMKICQFNQRI